MTSLVLLAAALGLDFIVSEGYLFHPVRSAVKRLGVEWMSEMSTCSQCLGFWSGVIVELSARVFGGTSVVPGVPWLMAAVVVGLATSGLAVVVVSLRR